MILMTNIFLLLSVKNKFKMNKPGKGKGKFNSKKPNMKNNYKKKKDEDEDDGKFEVIDQAKQNKVSREIELWNWLKLLVASSVHSYLNYFSKSIKSLKN